MPRIFPASIIVIRCLGKNCARTAAGPSKLKIERLMLLSIFVVKFFVEFNSYLQLHRKKSEFFSEGEYPAAGYRRMFVAMEDRTHQTDNECVMCSASICSVSLWT